jgi:leader peptidase (prepilin peptidase) / N-methyltransferase
MIWKQKRPPAFLVDPGILCYSYSGNRTRFKDDQMGVMPFLFVFLLGTIIGSFLNVCIHRMPRHESIISPRSRCPACQSGIRPIDNIPILSFLLLGGKCRKCRTPISWSYPLVEFLNGLGYILLVWRFGLAWPAAVYALLFSALIVVTFIDLAHQIIPNEITLPGMVIGMIAAGIVLPQGFWNSLIGLLLGGGLFYLIADLSYRVLKQEGMGGGDIKLIAMVGAFLGWQNVLLTIFIGALAGSVVGLFLILLKGKGRRFPIPFGPFLALGALTSLFWGGEILRWYFSGGFWR